VRFREAIVDGRLEHLHATLRDLGAAQTADDFLTLAAEHAADDDFDPPGRGDRALGALIHEMPKMLLMPECRYANGHTVGLSERSERIAPKPGRGEGGPLTRRPTTV
jgi:hypothetical protein